MVWDELMPAQLFSLSEICPRRNDVSRWRKVVVLSLLFLILLVPNWNPAMSSEPQNNSSKYKIESVAPEHSKLRLSGEALQLLNQESFLLATVKVAKEGYIPAGIEIRALISPFIFTAKIPRERLAQLEHDPAVVSMELVSTLR